MKKSITLGIALIAAVNIISAANAKSSVITDLNRSVISQTNNVHEKTDFGFITLADPSLIATELGSLKKSPITIDETIIADSQIIQSNIPAKTPVLKLQKRTKKAAVKLTHTLAN